MDVKKRHLFQIDERIFFIIVFSIALLAFIAGIIFNIIYYIKQERGLGEFLLFEILCIFCLFLFTLVLYFDIFKFSYVLISNDKIQYICLREKYKKTFSFKDINYVLTTELGYSGYKKFTTQKFIIISPNNLILSKSKIIVSNYIKYIKNRNVILMQYNERDFNNILNLVNKAKQN